MTNNTHACTNHLDKLPVEILDFIYKIYFRDYYSNYVLQEYEKKHGEIDNDYEDFSSGLFLNNGSNCYSCILKNSLFHIKNSKKQSNIRVMNDFYDIICYIVYKRRFFDDVEYFCDPDSIDEYLDCFWDLYKDNLY